MTNYCKFVQRDVTWKLGKIGLWAEQITQASPGMPSIAPR